ncbi:hypothetical protein ZOSMA_116G00840 [Zostera marina]|uniref:Uncharacterized protein n=1 Tax=Zostera marina TaxID=29655 RepID=A0A0K9Q4A8_ZOSMR|nr:hypothetical protein ZOSMA_116G00840 [Zostera marina]
MAAPIYSTPFQPYVYQSPQESVTPFQILGGEAQIVQIMLKSQEKITAKPNSMCYMSESIKIGSVYPPQHEGGVWQWFFGKNATKIILSNSGQDDGFVGIAAPSLARILPIDLANLGGEILCQSDAFLCSINDVTVRNSSQHRAQNIPDAEAVLRQRLVGQGLAFLVGGGSVVQKILVPDEILVVDVACILAMTNTIDFKLKIPNSARRVVSGGNKQPKAFLRGPGIVFIQSLPFHQFSKSIARAVTSPNMKEPPRFLFQIIGIFFFFLYVMIVISLIFTDL